ncbi:MAG: hypothetical protein BWK78_07950 [Thiotrichaceae bacterium IS1]|nr:MAG: hypothetical protein BWK78_07950 [Thiotrichaceae bacterium IS1]
MKAKQYFDVFEEASKHPQAKQFSEESRARMILAQAVYRERMAQSLSQAKLAEKSHVSAAVISRIENSQSSTSIEVIYKIFRALGKPKIELDCA